MGRLEGRVALVTGAARGIGEAAARRLAAEGAHCVLADLDLAEAEAVASALPGACAIRCDVAHDADALALAVRERHGRLDVLVNNAAVLDTQGLEALDMGTWRRTVEVNLTAQMDVTRACASLMGEGGRIVFVASIMGLRGQRDSLAYATAKGGVVNLTRALACELGPRGITVNAVAPGFIDTRMAIIPGSTTHEAETEWFREVYLKHGRLLLGRYGKPEDVAGAILALASEDLAYVTGQVLSVDGGLTATF